MKKTSLLARPALKKTKNRFRLPTALRFAALIGLMVIGGVGVGMTQQANAVQPVLEYCKKNFSSADKDACSDGVKSIDCNVYTNLFKDIDPSTGARKKAICQKAAQDRAAGIVSLSAGSSTPTPTPTPSTSPSPTPSNSNSGSNQNGFSDQIQNMLNQAPGLEQYIDILHSLGKDAGVDTGKQADTNYGSYVNGAGKQQPLRVMQQGSGSSPVILFMNGGGWHADDHSGDRVMAEENNAEIGGAENPWRRGYAMIEVTYRLGSSGVNYMYEDVMRGIAHVINNAPMYGIDPNRVVLWGDSAGGSLAIRAAASGKSGAKASVGWSAITNAYTAFFRSLPALAIGIDHSTCAPTDLAGLANFANLASGGNGDVAEYGQGLSANDFSAIGITGDEMSRGGMNPLALLSQGFVAGKNLLSAAKDFESITSQIKGKNYSSLISSTMNLASKKFVECVDNFNALSPALYASPDSPPAFMAEFENDTTVGPDQAYGYRDKLRQLGIAAEAMVPPGDQDCIAKAPDTMVVGCHLGYYSAFVKPTLDFLDKIIHPEQAGSSGGSISSGGTSSSGGSSGGGSSKSGGGGSSSSSGGSGSSTSSGGSGSGSSTPTTSTLKASCLTIGGKWIVDKAHPNGYCNSKICDTWDSACNGGTSMNSTDIIPATNTPSGSSCPPNYRWHAGSGGGKDGAYCIKI